jgi:hypothetical protein
MRGVAIDSGAREMQGGRSKVQLVEVDQAAVVEIGTTSTTHVLHRLCRVVAGRSRSEPVRADTKSLLQRVIPGRSRPCQRRLYRSVTPEVAGSSPVAPVNPRAIAHVLFPGYAVEPDSENRRPVRQRDRTRFWAQACGFCASDATRSWKPQLETRRNHAQGPTAGASRRTVASAKSGPPHTFIIAGLCSCGPGGDRE